MTVTRNNVGLKHNNNTGGHHNKEGSEAGRVVGRGRMIISVRDCIVEMLQHLKTLLFPIKLRTQIIIQCWVNFVKILTEIISHLTDCLYCSLLEEFYLPFKSSYLLKYFHFLIQNKIFQGCVFSYIRPPLFYRIICLVENLIILQDVGNVKH